MERTKYVKFELCVADDYWQ